MENTLEDAPRITVTARTMVNQHERHAENVPVLEGGGTLAETAQDAHSRCNMYLFQSSYFRTVAVIAGHEHAAWDWLADYGVLDGCQIDESEAREMEEQGYGPMRLGNAGEPLDIDGATTIVSTFGIEDVEHFHTQLKFGGDGWMHLWANNPHNDRPPFRDIIACVKVSKDGIEILEAWEPHNEETQHGAFILGLIVDELNAYIARDF